MDWFWVGIYTDIPPPPSRYAPVVTITNATSVCYTVAAVTATGDTDATATSSPAGVNTDYLISMQPQAADVQWL